MYRKTHISSYAPAIIRVLCAFCAPSFVIRTNYTHLLAYIEVKTGVLGP